MAPKLKVFYFSHILPELAAPRYKTVSGIRKPSLPWHQEDLSLKKKRAVKGVSTVDAAPTAAAGKLSVVTEPSTSCSDRSSLQSSFSHSKRNRKQKFVGRRINHQCKLDDGSMRWYTGTVLSVSKGKDGYPHAVFQALYDGEDECYDVEDLHVDFSHGSLKFIDL